MSERLIAIQIGAVSFVDEGTEQVLDILQEQAGVTCLFLANFTYTRGTGGRQVPGFPLPDHGAQEYDLDFVGGNYGMGHAPYYRRQGALTPRMARTRRMVATSGRRSF
jgi:hypothetical protein